MEWVNQTNLSGLYNEEVQRYIAAVIFNNDKFKQIKLNPDNTGQFELDMYKILNYKLKHEEFRQWIDIVREISKVNNFVPMAEINKLDSINTGNSEINNLFANYMSVIRKELNSAHAPKMYPKNLWGIYTVLIR
jgi:hypothetical protein